LTTFNLNRDSRVPCTDALGECGRGLDAKGVLIRLDQDVKPVFQPAGFLCDPEIFFRRSMRSHRISFILALTEAPALSLFFEDEDESGAAKPVAAAALGALFKAVRGEIRPVGLNACHSGAQARAISQEIDCTVGMNSAIGDAAAITFAASFYGTLAFGRSVSQGFEQGRVALMLEGIPEENTPTLSQGSRCTRIGAASGASLIGSGLRFPLLHG
jgi:hypothetical protein